MPQCSGCDSRHLNPAGEPGPELGVAVWVRRVEGECRNRPGIRVRRTFLHHAQRVAFRVGKNHPRDITLTDIHVLRAQSDEPLDNLALTGTAKNVDVKPQRFRWPLGNLLEAQIDYLSASDGETCLDDVDLIGKPLATNDSFPEPTEDLRLNRVKDDVLQIHSVHLMPVSRPTGGAAHGNVNLGETRLPDGHRDIIASNEEDVMASLVIRNLDEHVKGALRRQAADHGRSMEAEARHILSTAVTPRRRAYGLGTAIRRTAAEHGVDQRLEVPTRDDEAPHVNFGDDA